ncbi:NUDIX hydrolase domain-like protein, partial [Blyttiomyces helicus]
VTLHPLPAPASRWLALREARFQDRDGQERSWEVCLRVGAGRERERGEIDAVDVIPFLKGPGPACLLLVLQFRPPIQAWSLEFPSGLVEPSESPTTACVRELLEETGYTGELVEMSAPVPYEPGMTASCCRIATVEVSVCEG